MQDIYHYDKVTEKIELRLSLAQSAIKSLLLSGDLLSSETLLSEVLDEIYVDVMEALLNEVGSSTALKSKLLEHYGASEVSDLRLREIRIQLKNGKLSFLLNFFEFKILLIFN